VAAGIVILFLAGCSDEGDDYEYAIPKEICGVSVAAPYAQSLLPPGRAIKENLRGTPGESQSCGVIVDERVDLSVSFSRQTEELDVMEAAVDDYVDPRRVSLGGRVNSAVVGDDGAIAWMACAPKPNQPQYEVPESRRAKYTHLVLQVRTDGEVEKPGSIEDWRMRMEQFLRAYVPELGKVWCS
jgi:hypothetical protein